MSPQGKDTEKTTTPPTMAQQTAAMLPQAAFTFGETQATATTTSHNLPQAAQGHENILT